MEAHVRKMKSDLDTFEATNDQLLVLNIMLEYIALPARFLRPIIINAPPCGTWPLAS